MKILKEIPIAGVRTPSVGKNCGKLPVNGCGTRLLTLGHAMQGGEVREIEWAPPKEAPPVLVTAENPPEEYGPWRWATAFGRATGRFGADAFVWATKTERCAVQREPASG